MHALQQKVKSELAAANAEAAEAKLVTFHGAEKVQQTCTF